MESYGAMPTLKFYIYIYHLLQYCDMSSETIQCVANENYDDFQHLNFMFSQNFISLFLRIT
jgi:hypothetical protein